MSLYPDCREATAEELKSGYDFGASAVRAFIQSGENVSHQMIPKITNAFLLSFEIFPSLSLIINLITAIETT